MKPFESFRGWLDRYRERILSLEKDGSNPPPVPDEPAPIVEFTKHAEDRMIHRGISQENVLQIYEHKNFDKPRGKGKKSGRPRRGWMIKRPKLAMLENQKKLSKSDAERLNGVMVICERPSPDRIRVVTVQHKLKRHRQ